MTVIKSFTMKYDTRQASGSPITGTLIIGAAHFMSGVRELVF